MEIFGFKFGSRAEEKEPKLQSITKEPNDGSLVVTRNNGVEVVGDSYGWSTSMDVDPLIISEQQLISKYREMSYVGEIDKAIEIIINETVSTAAEKVVTIDLDRVEYSEQLKSKIINEFEYIIKLLDFNSDAYDILRRWYIDGRMQYQVVVDKDNYKDVGIGKLTYLDPRKLKRVRVVNQQKDQRTGVDLYAERSGFYLYSDAGFIDSPSNTNASYNNSTVQITDDAVVQVTSGLLDPTNSVVLSYLHKAIRPLNQLKGLEDATMIYKLSRAPERRIFYIDVGNLPPAKAEQVLQKQMNQYRSKMIYDNVTGAVRSDPKNMTMIEDYWLPRRSNGSATQIETLPGGNLSGETGELQWFLNKLYNSLNVPITRLDSTTGFTFGKTTEITRDEVALTKFVDRLRRRFCKLFLDLLKRQLALKNILNDIEFENIRQLISFQFESDNHFDEMLSLEVMEQRLNILDRVVNYAPGGQFATFFSSEYVYKNILFMDDEEIKELKEQIEEEKKKLEKEMKSRGLDINGNPLNQDENDGVGGPNVSRVVHSGDSKRASERSASQSSTTQSSSTVNTPTPSAAISTASQE